MALIDINLSEVPNVIPLIDPAVYTMLVKSIEFKPNKAGTGNNAVVVLKVHDEGPNKDRELTDYISLKMATKLKRLALSAGITVFPPTGLATEEIVGKMVKAVISKNPYTDPATQITRETNQLRDYLIPGDPGM